ncbi:MAG: hypothetical protein CL808_03395 [Citromicrobium sp.]|nr:hypothetical protein [Citromicrobium sp.]
MHRFAAEKNHHSERISYSYFFKIVIIGSVQGENCLYFTGSAGERAAIQEYRLFLVDDGTCGYLGRHPVKQIVVICKDGVQKSPEQGSCFC